MSAQKAVVISASYVAAIGIATGAAALLIKRYKKARRDLETSRMAQKAVGQPFAAEEWHKISRRGREAANSLDNAQSDSPIKWTDSASRRRNGSATSDADDDEGGGLRASIPQQPVKHPTMGQEALQETICLVMVGLPGRGKTAVAARTCRYLKFFHGVECELFNVGDRRRRDAGYASADLYSFDDPASMARRKAYNDETLEDLKLFLLEPGRTAIFDASNVTAERRLEVYTEIKKLGKVDVIFVELMSEETAAHKSEMAASDLTGAAAVDSVKDYLQRAEQYKRVYEPIASGPRHDDHEHTFSYIKCIDHGKQIVMNKIEGYMPGRIAQFITNCCHCHWTTDKRLYLSRHGQSEYNKAGRIGGDSGLTEMGERYAVALAQFADTTARVSADGEGKQAPCRLWTSTLKRTRQTARHINTPTIMVDGYPWQQMKPRVWSNLDEIYAGACDGMTYPEIKERFSREAALRAKDKLTYRYPRGESYLDVIQRLEPLVQEMERHRESLLIVGHQGVLRMVYAFYAGLDREEAPHQELKLNHVTTLTPHAYGCGVESINLLENDHPGDDGQKHH